jgi:ATP-dependent DNA ligase
MRESGWQASRSYIGAAGRRRLRQELVVEVRFDHVTGNRIRHGTGLLRWRPDKAPHQCTLEQIVPPAAEVKV